MALIMTAAAVIGLISLNELSSSKSIEKHLAYNPKPSKEETYEIREDYDNAILTNANMKGASAVISEDVGGIIRSDKRGDIYNVYDNALGFQSAARVKNKELGRVNFDVDNRRVVLRPSYGSAVVQMTVPNPSVIPGYEKIPNAWVDNESTEVPYYDRASNYSDPYGELISPFNLPTDSVMMDSKFGNPWGPNGVFNKNMRDGGHRLDNTHDFDPKIYSQRRVRFSLPRPL